MEDERTSVDLNGSFRFKTDAKGRISLPAKFRKVLSEDLVVTSALTGDYLMVFSGQDSFNRWVTQLFEDRYEGGFNATKVEHVALKSYLKGNAFDVQPDSAGRILLPPALRAQVGIEKDVIIVGNTGYFEVWSEERRAEMVAKVDISSLLS